MTFIKNFFFKIHSSKISFYLMIYLFTNDLRVKSQGLAKLQEKDLPIYTAYILEDRAARRLLECTVYHLKKQLENYNIPLFAVESLSKLKELEMPIFGETKDYDIDCQYDFYPEYNHERFELFDIEEVPVTIKRNKDIDPSIIEKFEEISINIPYGPNPYDKLRYLLNRIDVDSTCTRLSFFIVNGLVDYRKVYQGIKKMNPVSVFLKRICKYIFYYRKYHRRTYELGFDINEDFDLWKKGGTQYPMINAVMNQINRTGFANFEHRALVANFLTKQLNVGWQHGAAYFKEKMIDWELTSNNCNWLWACGILDTIKDRIYNPKKRDDEYIYKWS